MVRQVAIRTNAADVVRFLRADLRRQLPFAIAFSLTKVAQDAQAEIRSKTDQAFKVRAKRRMRTAVAIHTASKRDHPRIRSRVGVRDEFLVPHIRGGIKRPAKGARKLAIPTRIVTRTRTSTGKIRASMKPRKLFDTGTARATPDQIRRKRWRSGRLKRLGDAVLYLRRRRARIRKRWKFVEQAHDVAKRRGPVHFKAALERALTPRVPLKPPGP